MKITSMFSVMSVLYAMSWRAVLVKAVENPDTLWDDALIATADSLFNYTPPPAVE